MNDHFYIPKNHRIGILTMLVLMVGFHLTSLSYSKNKDGQYIESSPAGIAIHKPDVKETETVLPDFDPNLASVDELIEQGMSSYAAQNLVKFRATGWKAKEPKDLLSVYGIDSSAYLKFKDRVRINAQVSKTVVARKSKTDARPRGDQPFDPNTANYHELLNQGFSTYAANSLLKYLETGARIQSKEDLKRVYGVDEKMFQKIEARIQISQSIEKLPEAEIEIEEDLPNFDPNTATWAALMQQGLDRKTANSLLRFREKGAVFRDKEDVKRVYGLSDSLFQSIETRIQINQDSLAQLVNSNSPTASDSGIEELVDSVMIIYNLNTVTQEELLAINGIGPYYSKAIYEYGKKLGGYYSIEQLQEVPALRMEHYENLKSRFKVDGNISRISPVAEFKVLLQHPYIDYNLAKKFKTMSVFDMEDRIQEMINTGQIENRLVPYIQKY